MHNGKSTTHEEGFTKKKSPLDGPNEDRYVNDASIEETWRRQHVETGVLETRGRLSDVIVRSDENEPSRTFGRAR